MNARNVSVVAGGIVALSCFVLGVQPARAAVVLTAASGPAATFTGTASNAVNFTDEGSYAWVYYPNTSANGTALVPNEKASNPTAFSVITGVAPTGSAAPGLNGRTGPTATGVLAAVTTTAADSSTVTLNSLPGYSYISANNPATGYGEQFTYTMPANASQQLSVYCYTLNGISGEMKLTETDGAVVTSLYDDGSSGVTLPISNASPTKGGGVYRFSLENNDSVAHALTFTYTIAAYPAGVTLGQIGFEGATAGIPEPASAAVLGIAGVGLLSRRGRRRAA